MYHKHKYREKWHLRVLFSKIYFEIYDSLYHLFVKNKLMKLDLFFLMLEMEPGKLLCSLLNY